MNPKTTIVLLGLLAAGLAAYLIAGGPAKEAPSGGLLFPDLLQKDVTSMAWEFDGARRDVRRAGDEFEVKVGDRFAPADKGKVEELLSDLGRIASKSSVPAAEMDAKKRKDFALDPPVGWFEFTVGEKTRRIGFGRDTMRRDTVYAVLDAGEDSLVVDDDLVKSSRPLTTESLRKRKLLDLVVGDVDRIEVKKDGAARLVVARGSDGHWKVETPYEDYAEPTKVEGDLFQGVAKLSADEFVADGVAEAELAKYGLDAPRCSVSVHRSRGGDETITILVGADVPEKQGRVYFQREGAPFVYAGSTSAILAAAEEDPSAYRDGSVTRLGWTPSEQVEVEWGDRAFTAVEDHGEWHLTKPSMRLLDPAEMKAMLDALRELMAVSFVDKPDLAALGLAEPAGRIVLRRGADDGAGHGEDQAAAPPAEPAAPILTLRIGSRTEQGGRYVLREGHETVAYVVSADLEKWLDRGYHGLLPKAVFPEAPDGGTVAELTRQTGSEDSRAVRTGDGWEPAGTRAIAVSEVVAKLLALRAVRWVGLAEAAPPEWGLAEGAHFRLGATFVAKEGESGSSKVYGLVVGAETDGGRYARPIRNGEPGEDVFVISPADLDSISIPLAE